MLFTTTVDLWDTIFCSRQICSLVVNLSLLVVEQVTPLLPLVDCPVCALPGSHTLLLTITSSDPVELLVNASLILDVVVHTLWNRNIFQITETRSRSPLALLAGTVTWFSVSQYFVPEIMFGFLWCSSVLPFSSEHCPVFLLYVQWVHCQGWTHDFWHSDMEGRVRVWWTSPTYST